MRILAHRGVTRRHPENTLEAFADAVHLGVDGIETDVRITADGALVLHHDRLLADGRPLAAVQAAELGRAAAPLRPPRLEAALDAFPDLLWNLEVKDAAALPALLALLARSPPRGEVVLTSFDHRALQRIASKPRLRRGALIAHRPQEPSDASGLEVGRLPAAFDVVVWAFETLDPAWIARLEAGGVASWVYGPQSAAEHASLARLALEALITDHPERAASLRDVTP